MDLEVVEKSLLAGQWIGQTNDQSPLADLIKNVLDGSFSQVLKSPLARKVFSVHSAKTSDILDEPIDAWFESPGPPDAQSELLRLSFAVTCLHAFVQLNWTGPDLDVQFSDFLLFPPEFAQFVTEDILTRKSISELAYGGEPAYHLARSPILLRLAQILLAHPYLYCRTAPWWRLRTWLVHQQVLDEPVAVPDSVLDSLSPLTSMVASDPDLSGQLLLEQGLLEHHFGNDKSARDYIVRAAHATGLAYELTGALGRRTKFQQKDLSQLVLLAESRNRGELPRQNPNTYQSVSEATVQQSSATDSTAAFPQTLVLNDDTLLEQTAFASSSPAAGTCLAHIDPSSQPALHPLDQCILLSLCLNVRNTSPAHGLTNEQMSAYVDRVISHPANWSVHTMSLFLRSRLEASRTRTVERSTLQLQALVDQMPTADSSVSERLLYIHDLPLPSRWEMERELALQYISLGVTRSALEIFERLEMWEEVVKCWQSMERPDKGIAIVRDLLNGQKAEAETVLSRGKAATSDRRGVLDAAREAKLWCLLGDLDPANALDYYNRAWTISGETSGRAMRSLGGYHFARGEYAQAISCLRRAVAINPLLHRSWFVLGCACVREEDWPTARLAFTRCVAIDDEDGESWNNLASVYLRMGAAELSSRNENAGKDEEVVDNQATALEEPRAGIPFSNKMLAFRSLQQGLKYRYEDWRMWSNYMIVAVEVGELSDACRALARIVEERSAKVGIECVDEDVLERLVAAVTTVQTDAEITAEQDGVDQHATSTEGRGLIRTVTDLFERTILPRVSSARIFRAYARLLTWQSRWEDALKAHLDAYRCGTAGTIEKGETDVEKWKEAVREVEEIVDVLRNFGPRVEGIKWRLQARSIVRTFTGRTRDFEDEPEWDQLTGLLNELRKDE